MRRYFLLIATIFTFGSVSAQMEVDSVETKRVAHVELPGFNKVSISSNADVKFVLVDDQSKCSLMYDLKGSFDTKFTYEVTADSLLKISEKSISKRIERSEVVIYYNRLNELKASKATVNFDEPIENKMLDFTLSSSSSLKCEVKSFDVKVSASSGSRVDITGIARYISISASAGSTTVSMAQLSSVAAWVHASNGATVEVQPTERLEVKSTLGALVKYSGEPTVVRAEERLVGGEVLHIDNK